MTSSNKNNLKAAEIADRILLAFTQPLTVKQVSKKSGIHADSCKYIIKKHVQDGILMCLNLNARKSRVYWLTNTGLQRKKRLCTKLDIDYTEFKLPNIDWPLYGWICFSHRSMVIKILTTAMQPSEVKRVLRFQKPDVRISANNIRDVIQLLLSKGIVRPVKIRKKAYLRYELTELGIKLKQLLMQAENPL